MSLSAVFFIFSKKLILGKRLTAFSENNKKILLIDIFFYHLNVANKKLEIKLVVHLIFIVTIFCERMLSSLDETNERLTN